nr:hypothetical protein HK105_007611 [Polyrhizophydium stewartii]
MGRAASGKPAAAHAVAASASVHASDDEDEDELDRLQDELYDDIEALRTLQREDGDGSDADGVDQGDGDDDDAAAEFDQDITIDDQWFDSSKDFTKQFNRMRAHMAALAPPSAPAASSVAGGAAYAQADGPAAVPGAGGRLRIARSSGAATEPAAASRADADPDARMAIKGQILTRIEAKMRKADQESAELLKKYSGRINLNDLFSSDNRAGNKKGDDSKYLNKDKSDRATVEQVLDPRTRMILFKMLNKDVIYKINGCISTGKEANVYHAVTHGEEHRAIKIYKTSILTFKDRDRYVAGEFRFRHGYSKSNPRKMVQTWAEKEMRNLKRLHVAGIPCPEPLLLRLHVLLMTFIGDKKGWAAPRLKDAVITDEATYRDVYRQLLRVLWTMYHKCKLVHADFSEYNLLYHKSTVYVIDVSQSVEHDHPHALEFLRKDCTNVVDYFRKRLTEQIMTLREVFDFVVSGLDVFKAYLAEHEPGVPLVDETLTEAENERAILDRYLDHVHAKIALRPKTYLDAAEVQTSEQVFKNVFIPRTLLDVDAAEHDVQKMRSGNDSDVLYKTVTGIDVGRRKDAPAGAAAGPAAGDRAGKSEPAHASRSDGKAAALPGAHRSGDDDETRAEPPQDPAAARDADDADEIDGSNDSDASDDDGSDDEDGSEGEGEGEDGRPRKARGTAAAGPKRLEDKDAKKERKRLAKEEKREKRKTKVPKSVKKRKEKVAADRKRK